MLAILVGSIAGLGAVLFRGIIALVHNLLFLGRISGIYDANLHTPASPWGPFVILVPVAVATVTATYIGQVFFGAHPSFVIPAFETPYFQITNPIVLFAYVGLGGIMGGASTIFAKSIYLMEDFFEQRIRGGLTDSSFPASCPVWP